MLRLGKANLQKIIDIDRFALPLDFIFPAAELTEIRHEQATLAPHHVDFDVGHLLLGIHSFLLRTGDLNILIDSCVGEHKHRPARPDWHERQDTRYLPALAEAGLRPEDVDVVFCTHLHADHVGWNTRLENGQWVPTFPNARYLVGKKELEYWQAAEASQPGTHNHGAFEDSVLPLLERDLCEAVDDGFELSRGMSVVPLHGHSPGQIGLDVALDNGQRALFCGDAFHSPVQVFKPNWSSRFCHDAAQGERLRRDLCDRAATEDTLLLPAHIRNAFGMKIGAHGTNFRPTIV